MLCSAVLRVASLNRCGSVGVALLLLLPALRATAAPSVLIEAEGIRVPTVTDDAVAITWLPTGGPATASYNVYVDEEFTANVPALPGLVHVITGLKAESAYSIRVASVDQQAIELASAPSISVQTLESSPCLIAHDCPDDTCTGL